MIWKEKIMFDVKEQRLLDQKWRIVTKRWFSDLAWNKIKEKSLSVTEDSDENGCEGSDEFSEEYNIAYEWVSCCVGGYLTKSRSVQW